MRTRTTIITLLLVAAGAATAMAHHTRDFYVERCAFKPNGRNLFMNINRGTFHRLEGFEDGAFVEVEIVSNQFVAKDTRKRSGLVCTELLCHTKTRAS